MAIKTPVFSASNLFSFTLYLSEYIYGVLFILHLIYICLGQMWWHIRLNFSLFCLPTNVISDLSNICLLAKYSQMHDFIQCILFFSSKSGEWDPVRRAWGLGILSKWEQTQNENAFKIRTHSKWERIQNENTVKMRTHSKWERIQNENTFKMRTHSKWERIQNERTYAKWEQPQNGNTLKMTKHRLSKYKTTVKIQETHQ